MFLACFWCFVFVRVVLWGTLWTSWPPTWCAVPVGDAAWLAARCRENSDTIWFVTQHSGGGHRPVIVTRAQYLASGWVHISGR